ncbi:MAG: hypothetical protein ABIF71_11740 [Planctomycetota bacterium]
MDAALPVERSKLTARYGWGRLVVLAALLVLAAGVSGDELLIKVEGAEAEALVQAVAGTLNSIESFRMTVRQVRKSEFFEDVETRGTVVWKKPIFLLWSETAQGTDAVEAVTVVTPARYLQYIAALNKAETIDLAANREFDREFRSYLETLQGGYARIKAAYDFQVYRVPAEGEAVPVPAPAAPAAPAPAMAAPAAPAAVPTAAPAASTPPAPPVPAAPVADPPAEWQKACAAFKAVYGHDAADYRIKFKPTTDKLKRQFTHIGFHVGGVQLLDRITVAKADGEITETHILSLTGVNAPVPDSEFAFTVPPGVTVENLSEE